MRKLISMLMVIGCLLFTSIPQVLAQDVWAYGGEHDYYVMDDTVVWNTERTRVKVTVKEVKNGRLLDTEHWNIGRVIINGEPYEWRYSTGSMTKDHDCRVTSGSLAEAILQTCMRY